MSSPFDQPPPPPAPGSAGSGGPPERDVQPPNGPPLPTVPPRRPAAPVAPATGTPVLLPEGWVGTVTNKIVAIVDGVRAKTTTPIEKVGRALVWGLLILTAAMTLLVLFLVGGLRLAYEVTGRIPGISGREGRSVWMIDVALGVVLLGLGLALINKGTKSQTRD